jgi:hypothetical protein
VPNNFFLGALVQVGKIKYNGNFVGFRLGGADGAMLREIGLAEIPTATSFIEFFCDKYGMSKSGAWYCLKKLKKMGVVEFREKGEEYKPLKMTGKGLDVFRGHSAGGLNAQMQAAPMAARVVASNF